MLADKISAEVISIHAPREGGDIAAIVIVWLIINISIHAPREGGDFLHR